MGHEGHDERATDSPEVVVFEGVFVARVRERDVNKGALRVCGGGRGEWVVTVCSSDLGEREHLVNDLGHGGDGV